MSESGTQVTSPKEGRGSGGQGGRHEYKPAASTRNVLDRLFSIIVFIAAFFGLAVLAVLLVDVFVEGVPRIGADFLTGVPTNDPETTGIYLSLLGSLFLVLVTAVISVTLGFGAAIYLEEYAQKNRINRLIDVNISNLAGVPSIVYGLLGLGIFVESLNLFGLALTPGLGPVLLAGALTLSLLVLPVIIIATREALRAVPDTLREGGFALGATRWEVIRSHILPSALPGALTGTILALSRAIGEAAPLIVVGAAVFLTRPPQIAPSALFERYMAMPIQIFDFISRPQDFDVPASAAIVVLLIVLLLLNSIAIVLRNRFQSRK